MLKLNPIFPKCCAQLCFWMKTAPICAMPTKNSLPESINTSIESTPVSENNTDPALSIIENKPIFTQCFTSEQIFQTPNNQHTITACWALPIQDYQNQAVGAFAVYRYRPGIPENHEIHVFEAYAQLAALAIEQEKNP